MRYADGHCDTFLELLRKNSSIKSESDLQITLEGLKKTGICLQFAAAFIESKYKPDRAVERANQLLTYMIDDIHSCSDLKIIKSREDLQDLTSNIGIILAIEGGEAFGDRLDQVSTYYNIGVRSVGLTWNQQNNLACGVGAPNDSGITPFGKQVIWEMEKLGMLVDGAHLGKNSLRELFVITSKPIAVTHANSYALCPHPRNLTDEELKLLKDTNGVIGITFVPDFIDTSQARQNIDRVIDHIEYTVSLIGCAHVAIGSDFDGMDSTPKGLENISCVPKIQTLLEKRGFSTKEVEQIMFRNWFNLLEKILE